MVLRPCPRLALLLAATGALSLAAPSLAPDCSLTTIGVAPLNDMGPAAYQAGHSGGLYPGGTSVRPAAHEQAGLAIAQNEVVPRDASGAPAPATGLIGMISVGMSNTSQEFGTGVESFEPRANADPTKNPQLVIVNGAQGGQAADSWANPAGQPWGVLASRVAAAGLSPDQVQVAWIKQAEKQPQMFGAFPAHAQVLQADLEAILVNLRAAYPNLRMAWFSSRTRAYTDLPSLNPEPYAFESAFSVRWVIEKQVSGDPSLAFDGPGAVAPWVAWGPYLWNDGEVPRSDGFVWLCSDTAPDFTHPSASGIAKVADQLLAFFKTDPTATPWFLRSAAVGQPPTLSAGADVTSGAAPLTVQFSASASDADGSVTEHAWTFDDGGFAFGDSPTKVFPHAGTYEVQVTVSDDAGDHATATVPIVVTDGPPATPPTITGPPSPLANAVVAVPYAETFTASGTAPFAWSVIGGAPPDGLALSDSGVYSGTPTTAGTFVFTVEAANAFGADSAVVQHTVDASGGGTTQTFVPVADALVRATQPNSNFGSQSFLAVKSDSGADDATSFLRFDLTGVRGACTQATLRLSLDSVQGAGAKPISVLAVADDTWGEGSVTWSNQPALGGELAATSVSAPGGYFDIDVTSYVQTELVGDGLVGLALFDDSGDGRLARFDSREGPETPELVIECADDPPPAPTLLAPVADAFVVDAMLQDTNFGSVPSLYVRESAVLRRNARSFLRFDLAGLSGVCTSATLRLSATLLPSGPAPAALHAVADDAWDESTITWTNQPAAGAALGSALVDTVGAEVAFDVTAYVQAELAGDGVASVVLQDPTLASVLAGFDSREGAAPPVLEVHCVP